MLMAYGLSLVSATFRPVTRIIRLAAVGGLALAVAGLGGRRAPSTVVVRLEGNEFRPSVVRARAGDSLRFVNGNGGPHNIAFVADSIAEPARTLLAQAMKGEKIGPLSSPFLLDPAETYAFVVPAIPPGRYPLFCAPHLANMRGDLIVSR